MSDTHPTGTSQRIAFDLSRVKGMSLREYAIRFFFGAVVSAGAGAVSLKFGPRAGGLFLAFPAILPATLTLIERKEDTSKADADAKGGQLGGLGLAAFGLVAFLLLTRAGPGVALACALAAWTAVALGLYLLLRRVAPRVWGEDDA